MKRWNMQFHSTKNATPKRENATFRKLNGQNFNNLILLNNSKCRKSTFLQHSQPIDISVLFFSMIFFGRITFLRVWHLKKIIL